MMADSKKDKSLFQMTWDIIKDTIGSVLPEEMSKFWKDFWDSYDKGKKWANKLAEEMAKMREAAFRRHRFIYAQRRLQAKAMNARRQKAIKLLRKAYAKPATVMRHHQVQRIIKVYRKPPRERS